MNRHGVGLRPGVGMLLLLAMLAALLVTLRSAGAAVSSREFEVATPSEDQWSPAISGDVVVWEDQRNSLPDIFARNLVSGREFPVSTAPGSQQEPAISGDTVVWEDNRNGNWDVYGYNLDTGSEFRITTDPADQRRPAVSGGTVVWQDHRNGNWDIYGKDLDTGDGFRITTNAADQRRPAISGQTVVWEDRRNANSDIYGEDLKNHREFPVTTASRWQDTPAISGETVVWRDDRNGGHYDIYGRDLSENEGFRVTTDASDQVSPDLSGRVAVWADGRGGDLDIYGKDLSTGEEFAVSTHSSPQGSPAIDAETVVWEERRVGDANFGTYDIHGSRLDIAPAAPAGMKASGSQSGVRLTWNANTENDLAGYNVYRSDARKGHYDKLNSTLLATPSYSDENAPRGSLSYYRVTAVDAAGSEGSPARLKSAAQARTEVTLKATSSVLKYGRATRLSGKLTSGGQALSGKRVILQQKPAGARKFGLVRSGRLTTNDSGSFSKRVMPRKNTTYRVRFAGEPEMGLRPSISSPERVRVKPRVSLAKPRYSRGPRLSIGGNVTKVKRGKVGLVIKRNGKVIARKSVRLNDSRYRFVYRLPRAGRYAVRASVARSLTHLGNRSPLKKFRVRW